MTTVCPTPLADHVSSGSKGRPSCTRTPRSRNKLPVTPADLRTWGVPSPVRVERQHGLSFSALVQEHGVICDERCDLRQRQLVGSGTAQQRRNRRVTGEVPGRGWDHGRGPRWGQRQGIALQTSVRRYAHDERD